MQQLKQAKKDEKTGKMKISPAALALNSAEMGLEVKNDDKESGNTILGISSDQIYTTTATDKQAIKNISQQKESAAITMAKKAASSYIENHPETMYQVSEHVKPKAVEKTHKTDKANIELTESNEISGFGTGFESGEKFESEDNEEKYVLSEGASPSRPDEQSQTVIAEELDLSVPSWPVYNNPVNEQAKIKSELTKIKSELKKWQSLLQEAQKIKADPARFAN